MVYLVNMILIIYVLTFFIIISGEIKNKCKRNVIMILLISLLIINFLGLIGVV